jgi:hypothetical protein
MVDLLRKSDIKIHKFGCGELLTLIESRLRCLRAYFPKKYSFLTAQAEEKPEQASVDVKQEPGEVVGDAVSSATEGVTFDSPPDFTFRAIIQEGDQNHQMDFTITTPGSEDMLAAMQAIQTRSPNWSGNMSMPGSVDGPLHCRARAGLTYPYIITDLFGPRKSRCRIIAAPREMTRI